MKVREAWGHTTRSTSRILLLVVCNRVKVRLELPLMMTKHNEVVVFYCALEGVDSSLRAVFDHLAWSLLFKGHFSQSIFQKSNKIIFLLFIILLIFIFIFLKDKIDN